DKCKSVISSFRILTAASNSQARPLLRNGLLSIHPAIERATSELKMKSNGFSIVNALPASSVFLLNPFTSFRRSLKPDSGFSQETVYWMNAVLNLFSRARYLHFRDGLPGRIRFEIVRTRQQAPVTMELKPKS